jgi:hypothetical protein
MPLSWQQLLDLARRGKELELRGALLKHWPGWVAERPLPERAEPYGRRVLHQSEFGEVMLAGWRRNGRCAPHDHGEAAGSVIILDGCFIETHYHFDGCHLHAVRAHRHAPSDCLRASAGAIHDMHAEEGGTTLHFYWPAVHDMHVYDSAQRTTFVVGGGNGAWFPTNAAPIQRRITWAAAAR